MRISFSIEISRQSKGKDSTGPTTLKRRANGVMLVDADLPNDPYIKALTASSDGSMAYEPSVVHIPVKDGSETAVKPPTKSQQRRFNALKGHGSLTDDEVREQKNAKRREARAAKKAATTSTTTQPGQAKLV